MGEQLYRSTGEFLPDKLIADAALPVRAKGIKVASGEGLLKRGTLMGSAEGGLYKRTGTTETAKTGEGTDAAAKEIGADCILTDDVDATDGDAVSTAYVTGGFNAAAIIVPEGKDVMEYETVLRQMGIFLHTVQEY